MSANDNGELRTMGNTVADLAESASAVVAELASIRRVLFAYLVVTCGTPELAEMMVIKGNILRERLRKQATQTGGDV